MGVSKTCLGSSRIWCDWRQLNADGEEGGGHGARAWLYIFYYARRARMLFQEIYLKGRHKNSPANPESRSHNTTSIDFF